MSTDIEKVSKLTGFVDKFIQMTGVENNLNEDLVNEYINKALTITGASYSAEEIEAAKRDITWKYQIYTTPGQSILSDYAQENWYDDAKAEINPVFWTRYKDYLIDTKHFSPNVVSTLGEDTLDQKLMNYILNPNATYPSPVLRRGLVIGDVQSGKTSTYIGFICKAADAGYKVFILLTGTIEALRKQTQERVEEGFVGIDMSASTTGGKRVGVGEDNKPILAMALTSRKGDFAGDSNKIAVALSDKTAVVFVIKKQKDVLIKLRDWLLSLNADPMTGKIDMPMLLIDDEADNASINTSKSKEDPTTINKLIRELASIFTKSNYVGFTATPFANVFIDPETTEKMETQDLFPEDFIVSLPTPSNYIGPTRIFAEDGQFHSQLIYINDAGREEEDGYSFYFKHKKEWQGELPGSLTDAIYTFYLANAIRDLRGDVRDHRSMMINISRFVKVQKYIREEVESIHAAAYRSIKFNLSHSFTESMSDPILARIYENWTRQYSTVEFSWDDIVNTLYQSIEKIQIKVVNSSKNSEKLEYPKNESLRVIAIGGLALSRGLTLEGLVVSYFYRNTCTYDVLMQMGRWFGFRKNYEDLFRIWTHKASAEWYAEIAEATDQLKVDMTLMRELGQRPKDFGIRVRNNSAELNITAYNKMRNATDEYEFSSYYGGIVETPYLHFNVAYQKANYAETERLVKYLVNNGYSFERQNGKGHYIIQGIPKALIADYIRKLKISRYSSNFDTRQIADFLENTNEADIERFDIAFMEGGATDNESLQVDLCGRIIPKVQRKNCIIDKNDDRLAIGRRGKLGGPSDGITGIVDFDGTTAEEIIEEAKRLYRDEYQAKYGTPFEKGRIYPSRTWFSYVQKRRPILIIYLIDVDTGEDEATQKRQIDKFREEMDETPVVGLALGLPRNDAAAALTGTKYKTNRVYNWFEQDSVLAEGSEEE
jgi:hypothetical protein